MPTEACPGSPSVSAKGGAPAYRRSSQERVCEAARGASAAYVPVPVRATLRNPPPPPFTFRKADFAPLVVGVKVTLIVQTAWPTNEFAAVVGSRKLAAAGTGERDTGDGHDFRAGVCQGHRFRGARGVYRVAPKSERARRQRKHRPLQQVRVREACSAIGSIGHHIARIVDELAVGQGDVRLQRIGGIDERIQILNFCAVVSSCPFKSIKSTKVDGQALT